MATTTASMPSRIAIILLTSFLQVNICDAATNAKTTADLKSESMVRSRTKMTNPMTCRESFDHCIYGNVTGDRGLKLSPNFSPAFMREEMFKRSRCFCDIEECKKYGDCCPDIVTADIEKVTAASVTDVDGDNVNVQNNSTIIGKIIEADPPELQWECHQFLSFHNKLRKYINVYMRANCPSTWDDDYVDELCRRTVAAPSLYDYTLDIPVISTATNVTYRNVYCAICNSDNAVLASLSISIHCPKDHRKCSEDWSQWVYIAGKHRWRHIDKDTEMTVELEIPDDSDDGAAANLRNFFANHGMRLCMTDLVDTCPKNWFDNVERRLCSSTYALIISDSPTGIRYKNKHCAVCNGIARDASMSCPSANLMHPLYESIEGSSVHSYSVLVDFMGNDDKRADLIRCGTGEICDYLRKRCRAITCGHDYRMDDTGHCIRVRTIQDGDTDGDNYGFYLAVDCPKVTFYEDEFVFLSNNTIYVNETDTIYNVSEYEMVNESMVLVCASPTQDSIIAWRKFTDDRATVSTVCVMISLTCLGIHIAVHIYVPQLRNLPGKNLLSLSCALFVGQFLFTFGLGLANRVTCVAVAVAIHLSFLATFFWMNVMAFDVCRTFSTNNYLSSSSSRQGGNFLKYSLYAWLTPSLIVVLALANDVLVEFLPGNVRPEYGRNDFCWIKNTRALLAFFVAPMAVLITKNAVLFVATVVGILKTTRDTRFARKDPSSVSGSTGSRGGNAGSRSRKSTSDKVRIILYVKLALIMGLTWVFGLIASLAKIEALWYLYIFFNALQGAFIFFAFTFKQKILRLVKDRCHGKKFVPGASRCNSLNKTQVNSKSVQSNYNAVACAQSNL